MTRRQIGRRLARIASGIILASPALLALLASPLLTARATETSPTTPASGLICATELAFEAAATVDRITGPNAFRLSDGREIRLAGITTPHRWTMTGDMADRLDQDLAQAGLVQPDLAEPGADEANARQGSASDPDASDPGVARRAPFDPVQAASDALRQWLPGHPVRIATVPGGPDRYGRIRARVRRADDVASVELRLVTEGLARVEPDPQDTGCARALEQAEAVARAAGRGLWALPEFAVLFAEDGEARRAAIGHYVLIEGTVVSRGASGNRHYLNFGRNFRRDFAVVLVDKDTNSPRNKAKRSMSRFEAAGFDSPDVIGRRIRIRGVMMPGGGGVIWPATPEDIEWSDSP